MAKRKINDAGIGIIIAFVGLALLLFFSVFRMDMRWLGALLVGLIGFSFFYQVREKERLLLYMISFLIPFTGGFMYSPLVHADLIFAFDIVLFVLFGIWLIESGGFQSEKLYIHKTTLPAALMVLWAGLGVVVSISRMSAAHGVFLLLKTFMFYFYIINRIKSKRKLKIIVDMLIVGLGIQGALGLMQKLVGHGLGLGFLGEKQVVYGSAISRVRGTLAVPNQYGAYLILLMPIAAVFYISAKTKKEKLWYTGILFFSLMGLFFSLSRSSWFGLIGAIIVILTLLYKQGRLSPRLLRGILVVVLVMLIIVVIFWETIVLRFETGEKGQHRRTMIEIAFPIIFSHPILGVGLFNYQYHSFSSFEFWHPVHNTILRVAAEYGLPGLFFFLWFVVLVFKEARKNLKLKDEYLRNLSLGIIGSYTAFMIAVQFGPEYQHYRQKFLFWILAAIVIASKRIARNELLARNKLESFKNTKSCQLSENLNSPEENNPNDLYRMKRITQ